jgi:enoyl-CoA hydratase/carnithine racemase
MNDLVAYENRDGVCILSLNRPEKLNAINESLIVALNHALDAALARDEDRVLLLRGEGRAFSAGNDLDAGREQAAAGVRPDEVRAYARRLQAVSEKIMLGSKPVVGAIQGWAVGAGFEWALNCDLTVWGRSARAFFPELKLGLFPTGGVFSLLSGTVGLARAREMFLLGEQFSADQLASMGLVTRVVDDDTVDAEAVKLARKLMELPPEATARWKRTFASGAIPALERTLEIEAEALVSAILGQIQAS